MKFYKFQVRNYKNVRPVTQVYIFKDDLTAKELPLGST